MQKPLSLLILISLLSSCALQSERAGQVPADEGRLLNRASAAKTPAPQASSVSQAPSNQSTSSQNSALAPGLEQIVAHYRDLERMTEQPHEVDFYLSLLCRGAMKEDIAATDRVNGPHARSSVHIYTNPIAAQALRSRQKPYPVGTVIIKEKNPRDVRFVDGTTENRKQSIGGMRKREAGYDPENGDWEYFYKPVDAPLEAGRMASCIQCHRKAAGDHVFANWLLKPTPDQS